MAKSFFHFITCVVLVNAACARGEQQTTSPDGTFEFVFYSSQEVDAGKPPFGVVMKASGQLVWSAPDDLGNPSRPRETILWAPDSKRFALTSRVSTRRTSLFLFAWDGTTFGPQWKDGGKLEDMAYVRTEAAMKAEGFSKDARLGRCISDESVPERWVDATSLIVSRNVECIVISDQGDEGATGGTARALLSWDARAKSFVIARELKPEEQSPKPEAAAVDPLDQLKKQLGERLSTQLQNTADCETLQQSWSDHQGTGHQSHTVIVKMAGGIQVVTEGHEDGVFFTQRDYHLHEGAVYALRIVRHEPCSDGKTKRIAQSWFLFDKGTPIHRSSIAARVPLEEDPDDISEVKGRSPESETAPPPGLDGWGHKLTARAYDLARTFRPGVGRYTFGDWDGWLLKGAPSAGSSEPPPRTHGWLPSADTLVLPVQESESPDGIFSIGWGYEKGPVDWEKLVEPESIPGAKTPPLFSTKIGVGPITGDLEKDGNFLLNHVTGKPLGKLGIDYPGERQRFNHDELIARWSPTAACVVAICTQKWFTEYAHVAWIKDGKCEGSHDIIEPLNAAAKAAVLKSKHPAAKRVRADGDFSYTLSGILVEDDGSFEATITGQIPKDDAPGGYFDVVLTGKFTPGAAGAPAVLKLKKAAVLPYKPIE